MGNINEPNIRDTIVALYNNGASMADIGNQLGISRQAVYNHLKQAGAPRRTSSATSASKRIVIDENILRDLYVNQCLPYAQIERQLGVPRWTILLNLMNYNIPRRSKEQIDFSQRTKNRTLDRDTLNRLYVEVGLTMVEIAKRYGTSQPQVFHYLNKYNLRGKRRNK